MRPRELEFAHMNMTHMCAFASGAKSCRIVVTRQDKGLLLSEEDMLKRSIAPARVAKIIKHCLQTGAWQFDEYEQDLVLYRVLLEREFLTSRTLTYWVRFAFGTLKKLLPGLLILFCFFARTEKSAMTVSVNMDSRDAAAFQGEATDNLALPQPEKLPGEPKVGGDKPKPAKKPKASGGAPVKEAL